MKTLRKLKLWHYLGGGFYVLHSRSTFSFRKLGGHSVWLLLQAPKTPTTDAWVLSWISEKMFHTQQMSHFQDWGTAYFIAQEIMGPEGHWFFLHLLCPSCLTPAEPCLLSFDYWQQSTYLKKVKNFNLFFCSSPSCAWWQLCLAILSYFKIASMELQ